VLRKTGQASPVLHARRVAVRTSIDHSPGAHDDVANVVAGLAHCAVNRHTVTVTELLF
jgi:hypothetical protein